MVFRCELGKVLLPVLGFDRFKPNNTEAGTRSLSIIRLVMWEGQVDETGYVTHRDKSFATPCFWDLAIRHPSDRIPQHSIKKLIL